MDWDDDDDDREERSKPPTLRESKNIMDGRKLSRKKDNKMVEATSTRESIDEFMNITKEMGALALQPKMELVEK
jgi:hypothetical protein